MGTNSMEEPTGCDFQGIVAFVAGLIMGTGSTITIKVVYMMQALDTEGSVSYFEKPLTTTWVMFLAMSFALPTYFFYNSCIAKEEDRVHIPRRIFWLLIIPSIFDLCGTALAKVGLLYTTVSVYQLVRCTVIIITALLKAFVLKEKLAVHMWTGVFINLLAMCLVSSTTFFEPAPANDRDPRLGILFILLSCIVQGSQYVFEEKVMAVDGAPPLIVVGMEGFWGSILMLIFVFPIAYVIPGNDKGSVENFYDSWVMASHSFEIQMMLLAFFVTVAGYNIFAIFVTHFLSSIWHAILDNFRPISVWGTDLLLFYVFTGKRFGEPWTTYSWLQFGGMLLLFFGTAVYNGSVPCFDYSGVYESIEDEEEQRRRSSSAAAAMTPVLRTPQHMASPALMRSPLVTRGMANVGGGGGGSVNRGGSPGRYQGTRAYDDYGR